MPLRHLTGAQGYIKIGGVVWADATVSFTLNQASATHARGGKFSDLNLPGKRTVSITAKNIMRTGAKIGGMLTDTAAAGTGGTIKSGVSVASDGFTASTTPTIATPSQISVTVAGFAMTTAGYVTVQGTDVNGTMMEEDIYVGLLGVGASAKGTKLFKTVVGVYVTSIRSTSGGTLTIASLAGAGSYVTTANPTIYALEFGGIDSVTSNTIYVTANNCFASKSALAYADANTVFSDDVAFTMEDIDADLAVYEVTTN